MHYSINLRLHIGQQLLRGYLNTTIKRCKHIHLRLQCSLHAFLHDKLNLSSDQKAKLDVLESQFAVRRSAREAELRLANAELAAAIEAKHENSPEVQSAIEHFHDVMGELQKETVVHILQMRAILTPEQAAIFDRRVSEALTEDAQ